MKRLVQAISTAIRFLKDPRKHYANLRKDSLDDILGNYIILLICCALFGSVSLFIVRLLLALYYDHILQAEVIYSNVIGYSFSISSSLFFGYIFVGTFGTFTFILITNLIKKNFVMNSKCVLYSCMPLLLFGWIPYVGFSLGLWSLFLYYHSFD